MRVQSVRHLIFLVYMSAKEQQILFGKVVLTVWILMNVSGLVTVTGHVDEGRRDGRGS